MTHGGFQHRQRAQQLNSFEGMQWGKITPTDIDGAIDYKGKYFVFFEGKLDGVNLPRGQELFLERLAENQIKAGTKAIVIVFSHNTPVEQDVDVKNCLVTRYYDKNQWKKTEQPRRLLELIDLFFERCKREDREEQS